MGEKSLNKKNMEKLNTIRYGGIDLLKHILAIFVIIQHMTSKTRYSDQTNSFVGEMGVYVSFAVIGFFMISGFFFNPSTNLKNSIYKIFKRTMLPFFVFSFLYAILKYFLGKSSFIEVITNIIILKGASMQLYYLPYLFLIYIFYLTVFSSSKIKSIYLSIFILTIAGLFSFLYPTKESTGNDIKLLSIYLLSFGVGYILSIVRKDNGIKPVIHSIFILSVCLILAFFDNRFFHISLMIVLLIVSFFLSRKFSTLNRNFPGSGGVYLLHAPIANVAISTVLIHFGIIEVNNFFITVVLTYIFTLSFTLVFMKYLPNYKHYLLE